MEVSAFQIDGGQFIIGDFDACRIEAGVEFGFDAEAVLGRRSHNQIDNGFMTNSPYAAKRAGWSSRKASKATRTARKYSWALRAK